MLALHREGRYTFRNCRCCTKLNGRVGMSNEELSKQEIQEFVKVIADSLAAGQTEEEVSQQLVDNGWEKKDADELVRDIAQQVREENYSGSQGGGGSGLPGWVVWIGILVLINLLSMAFNWGFIIW